MAQCPACQRQFSCGASQHADQSCWCSLLQPLVNTSQAVADCYCPACLQRMLQQEQANAAQNQAPSI